MRNVVVFFIHFIATLAGLLGPSGVRSLVAESLLLKHQLVIVNRSRQRSPNLPLSDRILAGLLALLVRPARLLRSAIVLKPSTLLALHKAMSEQKYLMLFSPNPHLVLDDGISRKQAARFQDLLQQPSHAYLTGRANAGYARVTSNRESPLVSMATTLSGPLSDTGGCLISQRFALATVFGQPRQTFQEINRCFSIAACFAAPVVSLQPGASRKGDSLSQRDYR